MTMMHGWTLYSSTSAWCLERQIDYLMMAIAEATAIAILKPEPNPLLLLLPSNSLIPIPTQNRLWYECTSVLVQ